MLIRNIGNCGWSIMDDGHIYFARPEEMACLSSGEYLIPYHSTQVLLLSASSFLYLGFVRLSPF